MEAVYFWRESDPELGWLSQCYMMYQKAILFDDNEAGEEILAADSPRKVKALGRKVKGFSDKK
ncbi:hypothetical protein MY4038_005813 [Beauveria bassiana]